MPKAWSFLSYLVVVPCKGLTIHEGRWVGPSRNSSSSDTIFNVFFYMAFALMEALPFFSLYAMSVLADQSL